MAARNEKKDRECSHAPEVTARAGARNGPSDEPPPRGDEPAIGRDEPPILGRVSDDQLEPARVEDLELAAACAAGDEAAIARFEATYFGEIDACAARLRIPHELAAEARANLRKLLFVGPPPATASYAGRGDLRGWVRVIATRELIRLAKAARREVPVDDDLLVETLAPAADPELAYMRELYRAAFRSAFQTALAALSPRDRNLLRMNLVDDLSIDQIGAVYGVHRATAARWLTAIRDQIASATRKALAQQAGIQADEITSILRLVRSRLDASLERLVGET